jgi:hypothetical protein
MKILADSSNGVPENFEEQVLKFVTGACVAVPACHPAGRLRDLRRVR